MTWPPVSRIILGGMLKGLMLTTPVSLTLGSLVVSSVHWICLWMVSLASPVVPRAVPGKCPLRHTGRHLRFYRVALPDVYYAPGVMRCGVAICVPFSSWTLMTMRSMVSACSVISSR